MPLLSFFAALIFSCSVSAAEPVDHEINTPKTPFREALDSDPELRALNADISQIYNGLEKRMSRPSFLKKNRKQWEKDAAAFKGCPEKNAACLLYLFERKKAALSVLAPIGLQIIKLDGEGLASPELPFSPTSAAAAEDGSVFLTVQARPYAGVDLTTDAPVNKTGGFILARYDETGKNKERAVRIGGNPADFPERLRFDPNGALWISGRTNSSLAPQSDVLPANKKGRAYFLLRSSPNGKDDKVIRPFNLFSRFIDFHVDSVGDLTMLGDYQNRTAVIFYNTRTEGYENAFFLPEGNEYEAFVPVREKRGLFYVIGRTKKEGQATNGVFKTTLPITRESAFVALYDIKTQTFKSFTYLDDFRPTLLSADENSVCLAGESAVFKRLIPYLTENAEYTAPSPYILACLSPELKTLRYFTFLPVRPKAISAGKNNLKILGVE